MKAWLQKLFSEHGDVSMVRLLSLVCVITASVLAMLGMYTTNHTLESVAILCGTFLTAGMGAKVLQKRIEANSNVVPNMSNVSKSDSLSESDEHGDKK